MFCGKVRVIMLKGEKGATGTSGDYAGLTNKPQINGVTLSGNQAPTDLGLMTQTKAEQLEQEMVTLDGRLYGMSQTLTTLIQDVDENYATKQYVDNAIDEAITSAINGSY